MMKKKMKMKMMMKAQPHPMACTGTGRASAALAAIVTLFLLCVMIHPSEAKLLALDMGSDTTKIALVQTGRNAITLVTNEMSKRKTPTKVSFAKGIRNFGEAAASLEQRYPSEVFTRFKDALGQPVHEDSAVYRLYKNSYRPFNIEIDEENGKFVYRTDSSGKFSADELMGMMMQYFSKLAQDFAGKKAKALNDMALVVPSYYGVKERLALAYAGKVARKKVLGFITTASAAALHYAKDRKFVNNTEEILFFNVGAAYSEAALIRLSGSEKKSKSSTKVELLDLAWNAAVGAESLDIKLTDHFADEYNAKYSGSDLRSNPKSMAKLKTACKKTKEILSANSEAPISVESIMDDNDFRSHITRKAFESLIKEEVDLITSPLQEIIERSSIPVKNLTAVELLGGGSRVPMVQAKLTEILDGRHLDRHLDGDEAAVLGAALFAANASNSFVLKKFNLQDKFPYPLEIDVEHGGGVETFPFVPKLATLPHVKPLVLKNIKDDFILKVRYADDDALPPGTLTKDLFVYNITGFEKHKSKALTEEVVVIAELDALASFKIDKVSTHHTFEETYNETVKIAANATEPVVDANQTESTADGDNSTLTDEIAKNETMPAEEIVTKVRTVKKELILSSYWMNKFDMLPDDEKVLASARRLRTLVEKDNERKEIEALTNELESFILSTMSTVGSDDEIEKVTTEEQREKLMQKLTESEDWLYSEGSGANKTLLSGKLAELQGAFEPMKERASELEDRPAAAKSALKQITSNREVLKVLKEEKTWIDKELIQNATQKLDDFEKWLTSSLDAQEKLADHDDLVVRSSDINERKAELKQTIKHLKSIPKPKEKPKEDDKKSNATEEAILEDLADEDEDESDEVDDDAAEAAWGSEKQEL